MFSPSRGNRGNRGNRGSFGLKRNSDQINSTLKAVRSLPDLSVKRRIVENKNNSLPIIVSTVSLSKSPKCANRANRPPQTPQTAQTSIPIIIDLDPDDPDDEDPPQAQTANDPRRQNNATKETIRTNKPSAASNNHVPASSLDGQIRSAKTTENPRLMMVKEETASEMCDNDIIQIHDSEDITPDEVSQTKSDEQSSSITFNNNISTKTDKDESLSIISIERSKLIIDPKDAASKDSSNDVIQINDSEEIPMPKEAIQTISIKEIPAHTLKNGVPTISHTKETPSINSTMPLLMCDQEKVSAGSENNIIQINDTEEIPPAQVSLSMKNNKSGAFNNVPTSHKKESIDINKRSQLLKHSNDGISNGSNDDVIQINDVDDDILPIEKCSLELKDQNMHDNENFPTKDGTQSKPLNKTQSLSEEEMLTEDLIEESDLDQEIYDGQKFFSDFVESCLKLDTSEEMKKIVERKLKKHFLLTNPQYVNSKNFKILIEHKIAQMMSNPNIIYVYIKEVLDELKARHTHNTSPQIKVEKDESDENSSNENDLIDFRIRRIEKMMKMLDDAIRKFEQQEITDENESDYILEYKYKAKVAKLEKKLRRLKKERGVSKCKRPINFQKMSFPIPHLKEAMQKLACKKNWFPDFYEILHCIKSCASQAKIEMKSGELDNLAREIFIQIGVTLQKHRKINEYQSLCDWSAAFEDAIDDDPADKDIELAAALKKNRKIGTEKVQEIIDKFAEKQSTFPLEKNVVEKSDESDVEVIP